MVETSALVSLDPPDASGMTTGGGVDSFGEVLKEEDPPPSMPPIAADTMTNTTMIRHPHAATVVRLTFAPQCGQASAFVLSAAPHSLHVVIAMRTSPAELIWM